MSFHKISALARNVKRIPLHVCYCEVLAGAASLLFKKEESKVEIINDIKIDLVTLYRVVKHHLDEFIRYLRWILVARDEFEVSGGEIQKIQHLYHKNTMLSLFTFPGLFEYPW